MIGNAICRKTQVTLRLLDRLLDVSSANIADLALKFSHQDQGFLNIRTRRAGQFERRLAFGFATFGDDSTLAVREKGTPTAETVQRKAKILAIAPA